MGSIISFGMMDAGFKFLRTLTEEKRRKECEVFGLAASQSGSYALAAQLGGRICQMEQGALSGTIDRYKALAEFHRKRTDAFGPDPWVRAKKDLCFDVRDDKNAPLSFREFRVLMAIYSCLGAHSYRAVTARMIRVRSSGYKNEEIADFSQMCDNPIQLLTPKQVRTTVERLHETRWFVRVTPERHGRVTYYSNRLTETELVERIVTKRTFRITHAEARKATTAAISERIRLTKLAAATHFSDGKAGTT